MTAADPGEPSGSGAVGPNPDSDGKDNETAKEVVFVATGPCGESDTEPGVLGFLHVGAGTHFSGEPEAYIGELAVSESHQRRGVGRALVEAAREWAADAGYDRIALHASAGSPEALAFYRALGFEAEGVYLTSPSG